MSFSSQVKADALVACGRCCSICHRFVGLKIECHHIVQSSEGGDSSIDNCIPLCFECHADMRSYDHEHPRGTKYTAVELRRHRDEWFRKVHEGGGLSVSEQHRHVDGSVLATLRGFFPYDPVLLFLRDNNFAGFSYSRDTIRTLIDYDHSRDRPDYEFLDAELESTRGTLVEALQVFLNSLAQWTFTADHVGWSSVPPEWEERDPAHFHEVVSQIHSRAHNLYEAYAGLERLARRRLQVV